MNLSGHTVRFFGVAAGLASMACPSILAQEPKPTAYPRITLATWYEVDPAWPQKPAGVEWGDVPGISVDARDQVWIFTRATPSVQAYTSSGKLVRSFDHELIKRAHHLRVDPQGNLWLADVGNHLVMQFTPEGKLLRSLGTKGEAGEGPARFNQPTDMAITPEGDVFISDGYGNSRIVHFDRNGKFVKAWGKLGVAPGELSLPHSIVVDSKGRLYVADRNNVRVQVFDREGKFLSEWRDLVVPWGLWVTSTRGGADEIWVCGSSPMPWKKDEGSLGAPPKDQVFMRFNTDGKLLQLWTVPKGEDGKEAPGECNWVHCMALDSKGNLYAGDIRGKRAQKFVRHEPGVPATASR